MEEDNFGEKNEKKKEEKAWGEWKKIQKQKKYVGKASFSMHFKYC